MSETNGHGGDPYEFVVTRTLKASPAQVYKAWTEADRLSQWWGPAGMALSILKLDTQPGGIFHYGMKAPNGFEMWGKFTYRELAPTKKIVSVLSFADAHGRAVPAPMIPNWPLETLNTLTLTESGGQTVQTLRSTPLNASDLERETFRLGHASMTQGFGGTFQQLEDYLAR